MNSDYTLCVNMYVVRTLSYECAMHSMCLLYVIRMHVHAVSVFCAGMSQEQAVKMAERLGFSQECVDQVSACTTYATYVYCHSYDSYC